MLCSLIKYYHKDKDNRNVGKRKPIKYFKRISVALAVSYTASNETSCQTETVCDD